MVFEEERPTINRRMNYPSWSPFALALCISFTLHPCAALGATLVVRPDGTGDHPTVQSAVAAAAVGDVIELTDGVFTGDGNRDIDFGGKAITIRSQSGIPDACVIDCEGGPSAQHRGFWFHSGEGPAATLQGCTVRNGYVASGGAVRIERSSPTISDCTFRGNTAQESGGGMACGFSFGDNAAPLIADCTFYANNAADGGGVICSYSYPTFVRCTFLENTATTGGGLSCFLAMPRLEDCLLLANAATTGGGIRAAYDSAPRLTRCTLYGNAATGHGGGIQCDSSSPNLEAVVIGWGADGEAIYVATGRFQPTLSCCDIYGNAGGDWNGAIATQLNTRGNVHRDPLFCDRWQRDFRLGAESPCAPENAGACGRMGAFDVGCEKVPVLNVTWGTIRAAFR